MTRLLLALILLLPVALQAAGLGVYNPAQHAVNGFMPTQLPGLLIWLDAGRTGYSNSTSVASFLDFSGKGFNATNDTASKSPTITGNKFNGRLGIQYDGVDDFLICSNVSGLSNKSQLVVYMVINPPSNSVADTVTAGFRWQFGDRNAGTSERGLFVGDNTGLTIGEKVTVAVMRGSQGRLGSSSYSFVANSPFVECSSFSESGTELYKNNIKTVFDLSNIVVSATQSGPSQTGYAADNNFLIGTGYNIKPTLNPFGKITFAELIVFDSSHNQSQRDAVTRYLGTKYGIVVQ